jgi:hypothetical protein
MNMQLHSTGASFVAGREKDNPRDLVIDVIRNNPSATRTEQFEKFRALLGDSPDEYQRAVDWYFFVNMQSYLTGTRSNTHDPVQRKNVQAASRAVVENIKAQIMMLDLMMPNGKPMRDCTGSDMATFGNRFQKIAERVGKKAKVGDILAEEDVRAIMR